MEPSSNNLLLRLHKWAIRQDENFLTEAFAHLLQHLLENESEAAVGFMGMMTNGFFKLKPEETRLVEVRTQIIFTAGRPDLQIRTGAQLVYIEVKSESAVDPQQLNRYRQLLRDSEVAETMLVLLTRYPYSPREGDDGPDIPIRWFQIADWLEQQASRYNFKATSGYLVRQFLDFLRARNMTIGQVTWELTGGVRALRTFSDMLYEAAVACGVAAQSWGNRDCSGVYLNKRDYWLGIHFDRPEILQFSTYSRKVNPEAAAQLGVGTLYEWTEGPGSGWEREVDLTSEEAHFFARSKPGQMHFLEQYLRECLEQVRRIEIGDSGTVSLDPEIPPPGGDGSPPAL